MTTVGRHNIAKMRSTTTGTGTLTLTTAVSGFLTFDLAGVVNSERVTYTIRDGVNTEVGSGTYTTSGTTLSRDTVLSSTNGGSKISCSGNEQIMITVAAEDISPFFAVTNSGDTFLNNTNGNTVSLTSEVVDQFSLCSLSANQLTFARKGWYTVSMVVQVTSQTATAFNGYVKLDFNGFTKTEGYTTAMGISDDFIYLGPLMYKILTDATTLSVITMDNHLGSDIDVSVYDLTAVKVGNL
jgi:hypothetical protein